MALLSLFSFSLWAAHELRRRHKVLNDMYLRVLGPLLRPHEVVCLPSAFWFMLGTTIAVASFPKDVALQRYVMKSRVLSHPFQSWCLLHLALPQ